MRVRVRRGAAEWGVARHGEGRERERERELTQWGATLVIQLRERERELLLECAAAHLRLYHRGPPRGC